jgi:hypothetical protein
MDMKSAILFCAVAAAAGCTTNVENPTVNQQGRGGNTTCVMNCQSAESSCEAKCNDDSCKAACQTQLNDCTTQCPAPDAG